MSHFLLLYARVFQYDTSVYKSLTEPTAVLEILLELYGNASLSVAFLGVSPRSRFDAAVAAPA